MDEEAFAEAWEAGSTLGLDESVALGLSEAGEDGGTDFHNG